MKKTLILFAIIMAFVAIKPIKAKAQVPTQEYYHEITNELGTFKIWLYMTENNGIDHAYMMDPEFNTWPIIITWKVYAGGYGDNTPHVTEFSGMIYGYQIDWAGAFEPIENYQPIITAP
jgi:hypothetical protein